ncbi:uncharacterized protein G2W53_035058 [Senna tora]|uniref:Uncharacterized protein n=1 Tax=Senna tora TaxID=362788 RepID=A0A834SPK4_9FABA|nr:uncharacterized protein G2W53_035058 [Senna tora]
MRVGGVFDCLEEELKTSQLEPMYCEDIEAIRRYPHELKYAVRVTLKISTVTLTNIDDNGEGSRRQEWHILMSTVMELGWRR